MSESSNYSLEETPPEFGGSPALELPDWSGHRPHRSRMPTEAWLAYCRSNLPKLRARPGYAEGRRRHGIDVEFHL